MNARAAMSTSLTSKASFGLSRRFSSLSHAIPFPRFGIIYTLRYTLTYLLFFELRPFPLVFTTLLCPVSISHPPLPC